MSASGEGSEKQGVKIVVLNEALARIPVTVHSHRIAGAGVVEAANKAPVDNFVVLYSPPVGGLRQLSSSEALELNLDRENLFYVIESDRIFRLEINNLEYEWPLAKVAARILLMISGNNPEETDLFRLSAKGEDRIPDDHEIDLAEAGVEKFVTKKREQQGNTIFINDTLHVVKQEHLNGAQIKSLGQIESDYQLFLEQPGDDLAISNEKSVKLKDGMRFYSLPPATFG